MIIYPKVVLCLWVKNLFRKWQSSSLRNCIRNFLSDPFICRVTCQIHISTLNHCLFPLGIPLHGIAQNFAELHATVLVMRATVLVLHGIVRNCYNCVELRRIASKLRARNCAQVTSNCVGYFSSSIHEDTLVPVSTRIL